MDRLDFLHGNDFLEKQLKVIFEKLPEEQVKHLETILNRANRALQSGRTDAQNVREALRKERLIRELIEEKLKDYLYRKYIDSQQY